MKNGLDTAAAKRLDEVAAACAPAVREALCREPSPETLQHLHNLAAAGLRRRQVRAHVRRLLALAAMIAVAGTVALMTAWPPAARDDKPPQGNALAAVLLLAEAANYDAGDAAGAPAAFDADAESLAWRLLALQGFVDNEDELLLSYL